MHEIKTNKKHANKKARRVGRGGKRGKTAGRGTKGQNARAGRKKRPEMRDIIKKFPKLRGHGQNRAKTVVGSKVRAKAVNLSELEKAFKAGDVVSIDSLIEKSVVETKSGKKPPVKILAKGEITKALTIEALPLSSKAKEAIEKAGGKVLDKKSDTKNK